MEFVKLNYIDKNSNEFVLFVNPSHVAFIAGMDSNTEIGLISGDRFIVNLDPYEIKQKLEKQ